jgi:16S rRNA (uracil1498-N3)-methyltransferase
MEDLKISAQLLPTTRTGAIVTVRLSDTDYRCRIIKVDGTDALVHPFERLTLPGESSLIVSLIQVLPKKEKMELIIEKATELGVSTIIPCVSAKSITLAQRDAVQKKSLRWATVASKAAEQSRRRVIPAITECIDLESALDLASDADMKIILYEKEHMGRLHDLMPMKPGSLAIVAGAEGGFTEDEIVLARTRQFIPVRLGGRTLRAETAGIAAISIAQFLWGDL